MAIFDKISNMAKSTLDKTSEMLEITKLNTRISTENGKITAAKTRMGEYCWNQFINGAALDAELTEICAEIQTILANIDSLNAEIQALKEAKAAPVSTASTAPQGGKPCPSCGNPVAPGTKFCPSCGSPVPSAAPAARACPSCGAQVAADTHFCSECGTKID
jgi:RNA polymerase subunit RPABC4/transcription elongation factor Spt4